MNIPINVWYYNDLTSEWFLKGTDDSQETKDEYKYFKVLSNGKKMFYNSAVDYFRHTGKTIKFYEEYKVKDNYVFTDVKGLEIYQY